MRANRGVRPSCREAGRESPLVAPVVCPERHRPQWGPRGDCLDDGAVVPTGLYPRALRAVELPRKSNSLRGVRTEAPLCRIDRDGAVTPGCCSSPDRRSDRGYGKRCSCPIASTPAAPEESSGLAVARRTLVLIRSGTGGPHARFATGKEKASTDAAQGSIVSHASIRPARLGCDLSSCSNSRGSSRNSSNTLSVTTQSTRAKPFVGGPRRFGDGSAFVQPVGASDSPPFRAQKAVGVATEMLLTEEERVSGGACAAG